jgi:hypothetical protein
MGRLKVILIVAVLAYAAIGIWQVASVEIANVLLQGDMHDLAGQVGVAAAYNSPKTDEDFRAAVIKKAQDHGITLDPKQVTVTRPETGGNTPMYLAADYNATVTLPKYSFQIHFTPSSTKSFP